MNYFFFLYLLNFLITILYVGTLYSLKVVIRSFITYYLLDFFPTQSQPLISFIWILSSRLNFQNLCGLLKNDIMNNLYSIYKINNLLDICKLIVQIPSFSYSWISIYYSFSTRIVLFFSSILWEIKSLNDSPIVVFKMLIMNYYESL